VILMKMPVRSEVVMTVIVATHRTVMMPDTGVALGVIVGVSGTIDEPVEVNVRMVATRVVVHNERRARGNPHEQDQQQRARQRAPDFMPQHGYDSFPGPSTGRAYHMVLRMSPPDGCYASGHPTRARRCAHRP
jgi:hypothetical protein